MKSKWKLRGPAPLVPGATWYSWGDCNVFVGQEPQVGYHLSISTPYRNPTYEEIKRARYDLLPHDISMAMIFPPTAEFVNIHNFCFHLYQIPNDGVTL